MTAKPIAAVLAAAALLSAATAFAIPTFPAQAAVTGVEPLQGFNEVVGGKRFVGAFVRQDGACKVTLAVAGAADETLAGGVTRIDLVIPATGLTEVPAGEGRILALACTVDAEFLKLAPIDAMPRHS